MITADFWRGKRVLVAGHTGFKGSWLCLWLTNLGAEVAGFALRPRVPHSLYRIAGVADLLTDIDGDVRDLPALEQAISPRRSSFARATATRSRASPRT